MISNISYVHQFHPEIWGKDPILRATNWIKNGGLVGFQGFCKQNHLGVLLRADQALKTKGQGFSEPSTMFIHFSNDNRVVPSGKTSGFNLWLATQNHGLG